MYQQDKKRIYERKVALDSHAVHHFWNERAKKYNDNTPYSTVKLSDKNYDYAQQLDLVEKEKILPLLHLNDRNYVLDIGCGVGRLAEAIIPKCHFYLGVDYAEDLLDIARKRIPVMEHAVFVSGAFQELKCITSPYFEQPFDCVIVAGVCQYINDDELKQGIHDLLSLLSEQCVLYFSNPVAIEKRLTLKEFYSEELETNYSTIYRTVEEYQNLYQELLDCGFILEEENYFDQFQKFKETRRHYFVFRRRGKPADESRKINY